MLFFFTRRPGLLLNVSNKKQKGTQERKSPSSVKSPFVYPKAQVLLWNLTRCEMWVTTGERRLEVSKAIAEYLGDFMSLDEATTATSSLLQNFSARLLERDLWFLGLYHKKPFFVGILSVMLSHSETTIPAWVVKRKKAILPDVTSEMPQRIALQQLRPCCLIGGG